MKAIKIEHERFVSSVNLLDKIVGSVEPINRRVYFYAHSNLLRAYASDGCLSANISLGRIEHFDNLYVVPLDNLKLLSKSGKDDVEIRFGDTLEFSKGPEYMSVLHPFSRDVRKRGVFSARFEVETEEFVRTLDLGSIILREGQDVIIGIVEGIFFALAEEYSHVAAAFMKMPGEEFVSALPYESTRHLVKGLNVIGDKKIKIGYSNNLIGLKFSNGIITACKSPAEGVQADKVRSFLRVREFEGVKTETKKIKDGASLAAKFQRKNGGKGYIELSDKIRIGVMSQYSAYEYSQNVQTKMNLRVPIIPKKLNQFLSRLKKRYVKLFFTQEMLFFVADEALFAIKKEKNAP